MFATLITSSLVIFTTLLPGTQCMMYYSFEGDACKLRDGGDGICHKFEDCKDAFPNVRKNRPVICSYDDNRIIICCPLGTVSTVSLWTAAPETPDARNLSTITQKPFETTGTTLTTSSSKIVPPTIHPRMLPTPPSKKIDDIDRCSLLTHRKAEDKEASASFLACQKYRKQHDSMHWPQIVGGSPVTRITDFPFMAAVGYEKRSNPGVYEWRCGGMLVSERFVLTAAHCDTSEGPQAVMLGAKNLHNPEKSAQLIRIMTIATHPCYHIRDAYYDIALLKLEKEVTFTQSVFPACLYDYHKPTNATSYTVLGWGMTSNVRGRSTNQTLQKTRVKMWEPKDCSEVWERFRDSSKVSRGFADNTMICANDPIGINSTCRGDSGGPLYLPRNGEHFTVVGVIAYGAPCGDRETPGIFTQIFPFLLWLEDVIWPGGITS